MAGSQVSPTDAWKNLLTKSNTVSFRPASHGQIEISIKDAIALRSYLDRVLRNNTNGVANFLAGFDAYVENKTQWQSVVQKPLPGATSSSSSSSSSSEASSIGLGGGKTGDSLLRVFLGVETLQQPMIQRVFEYVLEYTSGDANDKHMATMLLSQLKWLDVVYDGVGLGEKLVEALSVCPVPLQREIILAVPDMLAAASDRAGGATAPDSASDERPRSGVDIIVSALRKVSEEQPQLTVCVVDTLSNLSLSSAVVGEMVETVGKKLDSVDMEDLPVLIKFLLNSCNKENAMRVVGMVRTKLAGFGGGSGGSGSGGSGGTTSRGKDSKAGKSAGAALVLEAVRSSVRFHKVTAQAFLKTIQAVDNRVEQAKVLDLWVLFSLASLQGYHKQAESVFRKKVSEGVFSPTLVDRSLCGPSAAAALSPTLHAILELAESLVRNEDQILRRVGCLMYSGVFQNFEADGMRRREVISKVLAHIGSAVDGEVNAGLDVLLALANWSPKTLGNFRAFLKGILDYLDALSDDQVRKVFTVFSILATCNQDNKQNNNNAVGQEELHIVIRKQLYSPSARYQRMGIIGGVALLAQLGRAHPIPSATASNSNGRLTATQGHPLQQHHAQQHHEQAIELATTLLSQCRQHHPEEDQLHSPAPSHSNLALLLDELARVMTPSPTSSANSVATNSLAPLQLHASVVAHILGPINTELEERFVCELSSLGPDPQVDGQPRFNLDGAAAVVAIKIAPIVRSSAPSSRGIPGLQSDCGTLAFLCPALRLIAACEAAKGGSLTAIDALLGCPFLLFPTSSPPDDGDGEENDQNKNTVDPIMVCASLLHAVNFVREALSVFVTQLPLNPPANQSQSEDEIEMCVRAKIAPRVATLVELEEELKSSLSTALSTVTTTELFAKLQVFGVLDREDNDLASLGSTLEIPAAKSGDPEKNDLKRAKEVVSIMNHTLRPLSVNLARALILPLAPFPLPPSVDGAVREEDGLAPLNPSTLLFLLKDYHAKLKVVATSSSSAPAFAGKKTTSTAETSVVSPYGLLGFLEATWYVFPSLHHMLSLLAGSLAMVKVENEAPVEGREDSERSEEPDEEKTSRKSKKKKKKNDPESEGSEKVDDGSEKNEQKEGNSKDDGDGGEKQKQKQVILDCIQTIFKILQLIFSHGTINPPYTPPSSLAAAVAAAATTPSPLHLVLALFLLPPSECPANFSFTSTAKREIIANLTFADAANKAFLVLERVLSALTPYSFAHTVDVVLAMNALITPHLSSPSSVAGAASPPEKGKKGGRGSSGGGGGVGFAQRIGGRLSEIARTLLCRRWGKAKMKAGTLGVLVQVYISRSMSPVETIEELGLHAFRYVAREDDDDNAEPAESEEGNWREFIDGVADQHGAVVPDDDPHPGAGTLSKKTFAYYFVPTVENFVEIFNTFLHSSIAAAANAGSEEVMVHYVRLASLFASLCASCKPFSNLRPVLSATIKHGRVFLDGIVKKMKFFSSQFPLHRDLVVELIRNVQATNRIMQIVCGHAKARRYADITANVPKVKLSLEAFIYACKALLKQHNALTAFWHGNLKQRELDGTVVEEEEQEEESGGDEDGDDEIPEEKKKGKKKKGKQKAKKDDGEEESEPKKRRKKADGGGEEEAGPKSRKKKSETSPMPPPPPRKAEKKGTKKEKSPKSGKQAKNQAGGKGKGKGKRKNKKDSDEEKEEIDLQTESEEEEDEGDEEEEDEPENEKQKKKPRKFGGRVASGTTQRSDDSDDEDPTEGTEATEDQEEAHQPVNDDDETPFIAPKKRKKSVKIEDDSDED